MILGSGIIRIVYYGKWEKVLYSLKVFKGVVLNVPLDMESLF